jgi:23S rRNA (cytosine1962-C5)-methyltransferase
MKESHLDGIRWILDDAFKYVKREDKRGKKYHGIILDPPAYGRGPEGEKWVLEQQIDELIKLCAELLLPKDSFFVLNLYSMGLSSLIAENIVNSYFDLPNTIEAGEIYVPDQFGRKLPLGTFLRFAR